MTARFPAPPSTPDSQPYWDSVRDGEWRLQQCTGCGTLRFPPGAVCRSCDSPLFTWEPAPSTGTVVARTVVHRAPNADFAGQVPYVLAIVELAPGTRLVAPVRGSGIEVGDRVDLSRESAADGYQLPVFIKPDRSAA
jgi:uncharacterized OB-fold protein